MALFNLRRYYDAASEFTEELAHDPGNAEILSLRAAVLLNAGYTRSADEDVRAAIGLDPTCDYGFYVLSAVKARQRKLAAAEDAILEAIRINPSPSWFSQHAAVLFDRKRFDECLVVTEHALELMPCDERLLVLRGKALASLGRFEESKRLLYEALTLDPENPAAHHAVGQLSFHLGSSEESLSYLREARRLDPMEYDDSASIAFAYGRLLLPCRLVDRFVAPWYQWSSKSLWAVNTVLGSLCLTIAFSFINESWEAVNLLFLCLIVVVNALAFSFSYRDIASAAANIAAYDAWGYSSIKKVELLILCLWRVLSLHAGISVIFMFIALLPPLPFIAYAVVSYWSYFTDFLQVASLRRGTVYLAIAALLLSPAIGGAIASFTNHSLAIIMWAALIVAAYFATDISHWIMRPRELTTSPYRL